MGFIEMISTGHFDMQVIQKFIAAAPVSGEQHLAEIRAEAYEAGFCKAKHVYNCELGYCSTDIAEWFDEWDAAKQKGGTK